ncbi:MAG: riboflavin synthase subunit alpha [SAR324 cluster bacterium]|jgi:riboflavin synthase|nr:riboflavin synthase subunit alpha [SAR324 cluster bacterium]
MFTGIVRGVRKLSAVKDIENGRRLRIKLENLSDNLQQGASVAVNGVCLTAVLIKEDWAEFDIIQESLNRSNLGSLKIGDIVNIERACAFGDEVGGHGVTGHVDCTGIIKDVRNTPNNRDIVVSCDKEWMAYLIPKGWIAIDGISLTVVEVGNNWFSFSLIPETLEKTVLGKKMAGNLVNLEFDHTTKVIVRSIERMIPEIKKQIVAAMKN